MCVRWGGGGGGHVCLLGGGEGVHVCVCGGGGWCMGVSLCVCVCACADSLANGYVHGMVPCHHYDTLHCVQGKGCLCVCVCVYVWWIPG